ncbi:hypothetical protein E8E11_001925 [Didymella keratinophila]|nr:hypothetical protein E8E11_001925 [Didymella keratinophila]
MVGTYLQGRDFSILMYPVADCDLAQFLRETALLIVYASQGRKRFLAKAMGCLISAIKYVHDQTTKHMDIKLQNILIKEGPYDSTGWTVHEIYFANFGLSRSRSKVTARPMVRQPARLVTVPPKSTH